MKSGTITYYVEIPVEIHYHLQPAERQTMDYPGCPEHIIVDIINAPIEDELYSLIGSHSQDIKDACMDDIE